jgi:hypothetical protein
MLAFSSTVVIFVVICVATVFRVSHPYIALVAGLAVVLAGLTGVAILVLGPQDLWVRHPILTDLLHPYVLALDAIIALAWGGALCVGCGVVLTRGHHERYGR